MKDKSLRKALKKAGIIANEEYPEAGIEVKEFVDRIWEPHEEFLKMEYAQALAALCDYFNIDLVKQNGKYVVKER